MDLNSMIGTDGEAPDMLDKIIAVSITLFILSVITEKITTLIRKYPRAFQVLSLLCAAYLFLVSLASLSNNFRVEYLLVLIVAFIFLLFSANSTYVNTLMPMVSKNPIKLKVDKGISGANPLKNIAHQTDATADEKTDEITLLSFLVGLAVAFAFKANLMAMFQEGKLDYGVWDVSLVDPWYRFNPKLEFSFPAFFGILTAGFFLSFGSKFFHDLIDTLLQTKELKRKLNDKALRDVDKIEDLDDEMSFTAMDKVQQAIEQHRGVLMEKFANIYFITASMKNVNGEHTPVAAIYLADGDDAGIPKILSASLPGGRKFTVQTEIVKDVGIGTPTAGIRDGIAHTDAPDFFGSICCMFSKGDEISVLSNCHLFTFNKVRPTFDDPDGPTAVSDEEEIGIWTYGSINPDGDFALVRLNDPDKFKSDHSNLPSFKGYRPITKADHGKLKVTVEGIKTLKNDAYVLDSVKNEVMIRYEEGIIIKFKEAILIGSTNNKETSKPVTEVHDSGGAVFDGDNNLVGIITGVNNKFTIAIPVSLFANNKQLSIL